ncbi:hypothetical protein DSL64_23135 [Dyadobacter luteus]|jgi:hypothetical protein|uniref:Uncharacterized protein n=1 Tax=Dyadobacter luteus TaxID=2259619 RepID=A0A3D8Y519_9BACT|nr:hypothetical protein [Dyadobacter luteus]REA57636.1 hypothetical protein DSL64_23135 [Dyadobacter luteus]
MLIIVLLVSLCLIVLGRTDKNSFGLSVKLRKGLRLAGQFGLGFFVGFALYAHGADMIDGFWTGFSAGKNQITQQP